MGPCDQWYKNAIVYCLDLETFADGDGDGIGGCAGLADRLDDLSSLGVTCLWLMPLHPTPSDQVVFPGEQEGSWTFDGEAGAWYLHHFHAFQPDLNVANPAVRDEFRRIIGLWLQLSVDGFRIDAAPFLIKLEGLEAPRGMEEAHDFPRELRDFATVRHGAAILLGEVDVGLSELADSFGGNELRALFNFPLNRYLVLGLVQESADPIHFGFNQPPRSPPSASGSTSRGATTS